MEKSGARLVMANIKYDAVVCFDPVRFSIGLDIKYSDVFIRQAHGWTLSTSPVSIERRSLVIPGVYCF